MVWRWSAGVIGDGEGAADCGVVDATGYDSDLEDVVGAVDVDYYWKCDFSGVKGNITEFIGRMSD